MRDSDGVNHRGSQAETGCNSRFRRASRLPTEGLQISRDAEAERDVRSSFSRVVRVGV
jgi:hypothetical protein